MGADKKNLFLTLLKIKSYLASMIDEPSERFNNFNYTREYLEKRYPDKCKYFLDLLEENGIFSDSEITFNDKIIAKFRTIAHNSGDRGNLLTLLDKLEIETRGTIIKDETRLSEISEREKKLSEILDSIFQLATNWAVLKEIEDKVDDYSILNDEEVIRPDEEKNLDTLDDNTFRVFSTISDLTKEYMEKLTDYYFNYGGNIALKDFVLSLDEIKKDVIKKYFELFKEHGLDQDSIEKLSK